MRTVVTMAIGALVLAGCHKEPDQAKTAEDVIAAADKLVKPVPGLYRSTAEIVEFEVPGIPPQQAAMMRESMSGIEGADRTQCLTQAQADEGFKRVVRKLGEGQQGVTCEFSKFDAERNTLDAALACTGEGGVKVDMTIDGTVEPEKSEMTMAMSQKSALIPGGEMRMKMRVNSERVGECK